MPNVDLAKYLEIRRWKPMIGDICIWHGWIQHFFGIIVDLNKDQAIIRTNGIPILLFTGKTKVIKVDLEDIYNSVGGEYAIIQNIDGEIVWYI